MTDKRKVVLGAAVAMFFIAIFFWSVKLLWSLLSNSDSVNKDDGYHGFREHIGIYLREVVREK